MKTTILTILSLLFFTISYSQSTVSIPALKDNTVYSESGSTSNGAGDYLFFGRNNNGNSRRAFVSFDLSSQLQPGDSIIDVSLNFQVSRAANTTNRTANLHRVTKDWGEGSSNAPNQEGGGTQAQTDDVTWTERFFGSTSQPVWTNPGGDFVSNASGTAEIGGNGAYSIGGAGLIADVRDMLNNPSGNFGWIIIGNESTNRTAKRINSRENSNNPIELEVTFIRPVSLSDEMESLTALKIAPNPVKSTFRLENVEFIQDIRIMDMSGKERLVLDPANNQHDISSLDRGIYLIKISDGENEVTKKLIKQ